MKTPQRGLVPSAMYLNQFLLEPKQMVWDVKLISVLTGEGQKRYKRMGPTKEKKNWIPKAKREVTEREKRITVRFFQGYRWREAAAADWTVSEMLH